MQKYKIWAPDYSWKGGYGSSTKDKIHNPLASRFDQDFFSIEDLYAKTADDRAGQYVTTMGLDSRIKRDMALDAQNPKEKLPEDFVSAKMIDVVPMFGYSHPPDMSSKQDFEQHDQVSLVQQASLNAYKQANLFTDPNLFGDKSLNTDSLGYDSTTLKQTEFYGMDGSAAGLETNMLGGEMADESYRVNSVETMTAF